MHDQPLHHLRRRTELLHAQAGGRLHLLRPRLRDAQQERARSGEHRAAFGNAPSTGHADARELDDRGHHAAHASSGRPLSASADVPGWSHRGARTRGRGVLRRVDRPHDGPLSLALSRQRALRVHAHGRGAHRGGGARAGVGAAGVPRHGNRVRAAAPGRGSGVRAHSRSRGGAVGEDALPARGAALRGRLHRPRRPARPYVRGPGPEAGHRGISPGGGVFRRRGGCLGRRRRPRPLPGVHGLRPVRAGRNDDHLSALCPRQPRRPTSGCQGVPRTRLRRGGELPVAAVSGAIPTDDHRQDRPHVLSGADRGRVVDWLGAANLPCFLEEAPRSRERRGWPAHHPMAITAC